MRTWLFLPEIHPKTLAEHPINHRCWFQAFSVEETSLLSLENLYGFPGGSDGKEAACNEGDLGSVPGLGRSPGEGNSKHSSILIWKIPYTEEPEGLQSMGLQRVGHNWAINWYTENLCKQGMWFGAVCGAESRQGLSGLRFVFTYLYVCVCVCVFAHAQPYPTLCNPMNYRAVGSSVRGILQARILE